MRIVRLIDEPEWQALLPTVEAIFFATSRVKEFSDECARVSFKARWLGRYLDRFAGNFFAARAADDALIGYLAGCLENPTHNPLFDDLGYYRAFGPYCAAYPCHLHINVTADHRNRGVGTALIEAFVAQAAKSKAPGMHIVTNEGARNIRFYERNGFRLLATTHWNNAPVVFMGRRLDHSTPS